MLQHKIKWARLDARKMYVFPFEMGHESRSINEDYILLG